MIDFLIIGGGIAGLSAGARLSQHGTVMVLEAEDALGYHASGRSAAMFEESYGPPSVVALNKAGAAFLHTQNGGYLTPRGLMLIGAQDQSDLFAADRRDLNMTHISVDDAIARVPILNPDQVGFAAISEAAFDIDTDRLLQDFARTIRNNGGTISTRHKVTAIRKDVHWIVTAGQNFEARNVVNAAGAWVDQIADLAGLPPIDITPRRRSMARLPAPGGHDVSGWPMMLGVGETWYAKPDAGKLLVSPSEADPVPPQDAYADDMVLAEGLARYEALMTEAVTRVETNWAGLRSFAPDGTLVLGRDPLEPSFIWSAGQGGYGFQTAPAASQLLCDLVTGAPPALDAKNVAMLSPDRLKR
ncbi:MULTISPECIES: FAD-binding oxidoreductase [unclassified Ruegeria]|uniref:NAD(P)/FAD-dependent oxidoreductase n=1 Tax=unclassified Ruegeria TaxID=2625375 RepID=UPI0014876761|nr:MULTISPECIES: FAD-dependent oxidoreductase [unclassified Ruegeria]NOD34581.1 FAD-dependent oxidoreductase [Ruegeria sp. HKCCD7296]NOE34874.1 FAD-dependent oxidoreductase [Ruegeria sp. HKCCD7318]NOE41949.1 FAD-dependent oxidoreductase [Ruegeria sp. HKCCD7319]